MVFKFSSRRRLFWRLYGRRRDGLCYDSLCRLGAGRGSSFRFR